VTSICQIVLLTNIFNVLRQNIDISSLLGILTLLVPDGATHNRANQDDSERDTAHDEHGLLLLLCKFGVPATIVHPAVRRAVVLNVVQFALEEVGVVATAVPTRLHDLLGEFDRQRGRLCVGHFHGFVLYLVVIFFYWGV